MEDYEFEFDFDISEEDIAEAIQARTIHNGFLEVLNNRRHMNSYSDAELRTIEANTTAHYFYLEDLSHTVKYWIINNKTLNYEQKVKAFALCRKYNINVDLRNDAATDFKSKSSIRDILYFHHPGIECLKIFGNCERNNEQEDRVMRSTINRLVNTARLHPTVELFKEQMGSFFISSLENLISYLQPEDGNVLVNRCQVLMTMFEISSMQVANVKRSYDGTWMRVSLEYWKFQRSFKTARSVLYQALTRPVYIYVGQSLEEAQRNDMTQTMKLIANLLMYHFTNVIHSNCITLQDLRSDLHLIAQGMIRSKINVFHPIQCGFMNYLTTPSSVLSYNVAPPEAGTETTLLLLRFLLLWIKREVRPDFKLVVVMFTAQMIKHYFVNSIVPHTQMQFPTGYRQLVCNEISMANLSIEEIIMLEDFTVMKNMNLHTIVEFQGLNFFHDMAHSELYSISMRELFDVIFAKFNQVHMGRLTGARSR